MKEQEQGNNIPFWKAFLPLAFLAAFYMYGVGFFSDDFFYILHQSKQDSLLGALKPSNSFISLILEQYTHTFFLYFSSLESSWLSQVIKGLYLIASLYMCGRFFSLFFNQSLALVTSFIFIFYPTHESTVYWYLCQYLMMTICLYLYAYYHLEKERPRMAVFFALAASFISYGSPAPALALSFLAYRKFGFRKALYLFVPNMFYSAYYIITSKFMNLGIQRLNDNSPLTVIKQFVFQILTFLDTTFGPSMWYKLYYSLGELTVSTLLVTLTVIIVFIKMNSKELSARQMNWDWDLFLSLTFLTLLAFGMFAVTGRYPNMAFNLGNRTNIFGTLLLTFLLIQLWGRNKWISGIFCAFVLSAAGTSAHWKEWSSKQEKAIVKVGQVLEANPGIEKIYIAGLQYSKMGPIDHIELFSEGWVISSITQLQTAGKVSAEPLNRNLKVLNGALTDIRYGIEYETEETLSVYDFHDNRLKLVTKSELPEYLKTLPKTKRHWLQTIENKTVQGWVVKLMPRLKYTFED